MSNTIPFPTKRTNSQLIHDQACAWLARLDAGASREDRDRLSQWLAEDPEHARVFLAMADLWDRSRVLVELSRLFPLEHYILKGNRGALRRPWLLSFGTVVAAICLVTVIVLAKLTPAVTYETAVGEQLTVRLEDGSEVSLNTNTLIETDYRSGARNILLRRGEAYFSVVPDAVRPFRVHTGAQIVEAVGTSFTVYRAEHNKVEIKVAEGSVNLLHDNLGFAPSGASAVPESISARAEVLLAAGEYAVVDQQKGTVEKMTMKPQEIEVGLAWRHGMLLFQGERLEDVLREMERYTTIRFEASPAIRDIEVLGYFRAGDVDALQAAMRDSFQVLARWVDDDTILFEPQ